MQVDWQLSQSLTSDGEGVRCACTLPVTGNQGGGLVEYGVPSGNINLIPFQHNHAVSALLSVPHDYRGKNDNLYVSGCKDAVIRIFDGQSHQVVGSLQGHEKSVTSLAWVPKPEATAAEGTFPYYLVSGSWDETAKIWDVDRKCVLATLVGHENSVCVCGLGLASGTGPNAVQVATGSAGRAENSRISGFTVRLWQIDVVTGQSQELKKVANDHGGPIRDICGITVDGNAYLATCSNDGTVKIRLRSTGESTSTLTLIPQNQQQQHPPMLLSVAALQEQGCLIGSAEDGHVAVWSLEDQVQPQNMLHAECVWRVLALPNGDFATCCQDGSVRIFTRASDRIAPESERDAFQKYVTEALQKQSSGPSDEEVAKLPKWEEQRQQMIGRSEGQVQLFQKNGVAIAAQWSMNSRTWIEVGQVMGSKDSGAVDGVSYDHVLPIEVDTQGGGVAKLQLGYNNGENPFVAAQRFIDANMLPQHHLPEIADYIQQRAGNSNPTLGGGPAAASTRGGPATGIPLATYEYLPMKAFKGFEISEKSAATTFQKMKSKIEESGKLSEEQLALVSSLMQTLESSNRYHATKVEDSELKLLHDMLDQMPPAESFPFLDLTRYVVMHPDAASKARSSYWDKMIQKVLDLSENTKELEGPAGVAVPMLSLRFFANAFKGGPGSQQAAASALSSVISRAEGHLLSKNKGVRLSVATVLYNVCFYLHSNPSTANETVLLPIVTTINSIIDAKIYESEALFRSLVALGTIVMTSKEAKEAAQAARLTTKVEPAASPHGDQLKKLAKEIYSVLA